jgi:hypothetical protein
MIVVAWEPLREAGSDQDRVVEQDHLDVPMRGLPDGPDQPAGGLAVVPSPVPGDAASALVTVPPNRTDIRVHPDAVAVVRREVAATPPAHVPYGDGSIARPDEPSSGGRQEPGGATSGPSTGRRLIRAEPAGGIDAEPPGSPMVAVLRMATSGWSPRAVRSLLGAGGTIDPSLRVGVSRRAGPRGARAVHPRVQRCASRGVPDIVRPSRLEGTEDTTRRHLGQRETRSKRQAENHQGAPESSRRWIGAHWIVFPLAFGGRGGRGKATPKASDASSGIRGRQQCNGRKTCDGLTRPLWAPSLRTIASGPLAQW